MLTPMRKMTATGTKPTSIEICVDQIRRERMSRPSWSLPSGYAASVYLDWVQIGSMSEFGVSCFSGSFSQPNCVINGTVAATTMKTTTTIMPMTAARLRTSRYHASCQSERCFRTRTFSSAARSAAVCRPGVVVTVATYWSLHWRRQAVWGHDTKCRITTLFRHLYPWIEHAVHEIDREVRDRDEERV